MKPQVLILSSVYDFSTDRVAVRLTENGVPFIRINREQLTEYRFMMDPVTPILSVRTGNFHAELGNNLLSIWFRQPVFLRNTPSESFSLEEQLKRSQWSAFLRSLSVFDSVSWMNWPQSTYLAESKPYQLLMAKRCGFDVPHTLVGNDAELFGEIFTQELLIKSLDTVLLREGSDCLFTYSTACNAQELIPGRVTAAPLMVQEYLASKTDLRVTVIGTSVSAVRILSKGKGIIGDWRLVPRHLLTYEDVKLPQELIDACQNLTSRLGLSFAAIDLLGGCPRIK